MSLGSCPAANGELEPPELVRAIAEKHRPSRGVGDQDVGNSRRDSRRRPKPSWPLPNAYCHLAIGPAHRRHHANAAGKKTQECAQHRIGHHPTPCGPWSLVLCRSVSRSSDRKRMHDSSGPHTPHSSTLPARRWLQVLRVIISKSPTCTHDRRCTNGVPQVRISDLESTLAAVRDRGTPHPSPSGSRKGARKTI